MTLPVMGTAEGYSEEEAKPPAIALGIALQITNILRDVGEDAVSQVEEEEEVLAMRVVLRARMCLQGFEPLLFYLSTSMLKHCITLQLSASSALLILVFEQVRGRIYLPIEDMAKFGVTEQQILNGKLDDNYRYGVPS